MGDVHTSLLWFDRLIGTRPLPTYLTVPHSTAIHLTTQSISPTVVPFTSFIHYHASSKDTHGARDWFLRVLEAGVRPNIHTFAALLHGCARSGDISGAEEWIQRMREEYPDLVLDGTCYNTLINVCIGYF